MDEIHVLARNLRFPRSPAFDSNGCIWCAEQEGKALIRRSRDGSIQYIQTDGCPTGTAVWGDYVWFCDSGKNTIGRLHIHTGQLETVLDELDGQPLLSPGSLMFDPAGNLIFTCPGSSVDHRLGYVAVLRASGPPEIITEGLDYPDGLAFFPATHILCITEARQQRIWSGYWDTAELTWETIRVWATVAEPSPNKASGPAGMCIGPDGCLYVAVTGAGQIQVFSLDGQFIRAIALPGQRPTGCCFDPSGNLGLIVTEAERGELLSVTL